MNLTDLSVIRDVMERHGIRFQKQFGQNFLTNAAIPQKIADAATEQQDGEINIMEIGPGIGCLTQQLSLRATRVVSFEIDRGLIPVLEETLADRDNVKIISQDVLKADLHKVWKEDFLSQPFSVCANLPYNITTPILMKLLESSLPIRTVTVMVQKEVADRFCSAPGSEDYGAVTAVLSYYGKAKKLFSVSAGNFTPRPKVDSAVIQITLYDEKPLQPKDEASMLTLIRAAFGQRRKTLINALSGANPSVPKEMIKQAVIACNFSETVRGESLSVADFCRLSDYFTDCGLNI